MFIGIVPNLPLVAAALSTKDLAIAGGAPKGRRKQALCIVGAV